MWRKMKNKKLYPFTRNHYFYGKLLTVRDFEEEQKYFNDKRRLTNLLLHGPGVVAGLDIVKIDDKTISVEAGLAVDYQGREIIVPESITCRLDILDGFERLFHIDEVYLCIEYQEETKEEVHSIAGAMAGGGMDSDFNRIGEGYHLFLTEVSPQKEKISLSCLAKVQKILFEQTGITIKQEIPYYANPGQTVLIRVTIEKSNVALPVEIEYKIISAAFSNPILVQFKEEEIHTYQTIDLTYYVPIQKEITRGTIPVSQIDGTVLIGSTSYPILEKSLASLQIVFRSPAEHIIQKYRKLHLEDLTGERAEEMLYLAKLQLIRRNEVYYIEEIKDLPFGQVILNNELLTLLLETKTQQFYLEEQISTSEQAATNQLPVEDENFLKFENSFQSTSEEVSCGETYIETELHSSGKTYYSDELAHGLGIGNVFLSAAVETKSDSDMPILIFGDPSVFSKGTYKTGLPEYQLAVTVNPSKGTFRIGIHFLGDIMAAHILVRWQARKVKQKDSSSKVKVNLEPTTARIKPKEKIKFDVQIEGGESQECNWSITDIGGGWIDKEGWYEAPTREGVYEIIAESTRYPGKKASAFVVVKKG